MVVASLAEVAQDMGAPISAHVDVIFPHLMFSFSLHELCIETKPFGNVVFAEDNAVSAQRIGVISSNQ